MIRFLLLLCIVLQTSLTPQESTYVGTYERFSDPVNAGARTYRLILNANGTFSFHLHREAHPSQPEKNRYGKGTWKLEKKHVIYFYTDSTDLDTKFQLDFDTSKARVKRKSPRDKSDRIIKESLRFYDSEIFWIKGLELFKI